MSWLDAVPLPLRAALIGGSVALLGGSTVGLGALGADASASNVAAAVAIGLTALAWTAAWRRFGLRRSWSAQAEGLQALLELQDRRERAVASWTPPLPSDERLSSVSFPSFAAEVRALAGSGPAACPRLLGVDGETARLLVREPERSRILTVRLPQDGGPLALVGSEVVPGTPDPAPASDPGWPAARRALVARDRAFDVAGFEAQAREISVALDAGDDTARPYLTDDGALDLAWWRIGGLPPGGEDVEWLEVTQDARFDRIELRVGGRVLSLLRPAARAEAPWELWRLRSAGRAG